jgi:TolA-binding protein
MDPKKGKPGPAKPFLGDDDLLNELDAWDATFDALHGGPEAQPGNKPVMQWPEPEAPEPALTQPDPTDLVHVGPPDPHTLEDFGPEADIDDQMTLDGAIEDQTFDRGPARIRTTVDPQETDFSEVGADRPPSALGDLLGRGSPVPPPPLDDATFDTNLDDEDDDREETRIRRPGSNEDEEDDVFTSASRPAPRLPDDSADIEIEEDDLAPPPMPERRGPAIVRRTTPIAIPLAQRKLTPSRGVDAGMFSDNTMVQHADDIEAQVMASRHSSPTAPPAIDEDAYDDIEIDERENQPVEPIHEPPASQPVRRTAHVLRRTEALTRPPPPPPTTGPVILMDADDVLTPPPPRSQSQSEDDFSDVVEASVQLQVPFRPGSQTVNLDLENLEVAPPQDDPAAGVEQLVDAEPEVDTPDPGATMPKMIAMTTLAGVRADTARPPALTDLYPRVKTPTSVPPLGMVMPRRTLIDTAVPPPTAEPRPPGRPSTRLQTPIPIEVDAPEAVEIEPALDLETIGREWPEQVAPLPSAVLDEAYATALLVYEREVATLDDSATSAALRIEAGRLSERLSDTSRARVHYDAALLADPRATAALRGLRRLARASGDLGEATRHLDTEIAVAGALERRPLVHYRIDLLMASGEQDLARVAVGEMLDSAPSDIRALLAQLELAFLDGRADEFGLALERIAHAVTDHELRAAVQSARGTLAAHHNDTAAAASWFAAAAESDPAALAARLGAVRHAAAQGDGPAAGRALLDLARQIEGTDACTAAAAAIRAQQWSPPASPNESGEDTGTAAAQLAIIAMPDDPLVARLAAETAAASDDPASAGAAFAHWSRYAKAPADRAYAAARAAELDPGRSAELWASVIELDPGDDYAAAQLRTAHVASEVTQAAIDVDLAIAADPERDRARLRAAYGLIAQGQLEAAIARLQQGRAARPDSIAIAEALGEALAAAGKWTERAQLFAELAEVPGEQLDRDIAQMRSALAWEEAVGAASAAEAPDPEELQRATASALAAWERVLETNRSAPDAHAAAIVLASRLGDREVISEVLARAQAAIVTTPGNPLTAASLAFRRVRLHGDDPARVESLLRDLQPLDDPRRTVALAFHAAKTNDLADAAAAFEDRANQLGSSTEAAALRLRAAQIALDTGDAPRATRLLQLVEQALPQLGVVPDLLAAARRRAGDRPTVSTAARRTESTASSADAFARIVRDADLAASQGDGAAALALYQRALELRPGDPLATVPLVRIATELREAAPLTALALSRLRAAEDAGDGAATAVAYELLAQIDGELRDDRGQVQIALESATQADPSRIDLMHRLERHYGDEVPELLRLRKLELETIPPDHTKDRAALQLDIAGLATRDGRTELELAEIYRSVLATDPAMRLALLHLESIVRRAGFSAELAELEEKIAAYFEGDPRTQAAFWTRAGETLSEINDIDGAVQRFGRADAVLPGHIPALVGWKHAALKGQLWIDVAEAANRQAAALPVTAPSAVRAGLHHFAGVALMDKALVGEQAMEAFKRALSSEPGHKDAFLRLRILLEEDANHDDLATLLAQRLDVETDPKAKTELHRALAELHRNFLSDRETATRHYRAILEGDPNDLRCHAAIADIAWEQGNWQEAADALMARARLERQPEVLKTLCFRLGLIYADRLVDVPMALKAFQRALTYQPDDENVLTRLADLAAGIGEWKLALGACERLVKNETDPERRAQHLHRVARIFKAGFGDMKRAERALNLALDSAPTSDEALQELVQFYRDARDITSVRVHLNRVSGAMRARVAQNPQDGIPYRVISRAMSARAATGLAGSLPIARAAAELSDLLASSGEPEKKLLQAPQRPDLTLLIKPEADDVLFPRGVQVELRQVFQLLGDRISKHVGVNLNAYGVTRGDRLRAKDNPVAAVAQSVATAMGFGDIDVYVSNRQPWVMVAEPTSPVSLVIGSAIAGTGGDAIRFAAGGALKLAQTSLAIPARLAPDELGVLVFALFRLFQPEFPMKGVDADAVATQAQKLKRLIPTSLVNELRPFVMAIDAQHFDHRTLSRDLKIAALRAGLVASGSILAGLRILASQVEGELPGFLADPVAQGLVAFALGEDHAAVAR